MLKCWRNKK